MAATPGLGPGAFGREGSTPSSGTKYTCVNIKTCEQVLKT